MNIEQHRQKAERIERSLDKCPPDRFEMTIEAAMLAGTHWFNIALHRMQLTAPDSDVMHAQYLSGADRLKISLLAPEMLDALDAIEQSRPAFVRGDLAGGAEAAQRCREALAVIREAALHSKPFKS